MSFIKGASPFIGAITPPTANVPCIPIGGGSRNTPMQPGVETPPPMVPVNFNQPIVQTLSDRSRRLIDLYREEQHIIPTIVF